MRRNVAARLARTRAEARDYKSTKSLEGFQIHCLAHAFCNSIELGGEWVGSPRLQHYCVFGIADPRWHAMHCTLTTSDAGFPIWLPKVVLTSLTIFIMTRAVFFCCFSSEAASSGTWPLAPGCAPAISAWQ